MVSGSLIPIVLNRLMNEIYIGSLMACRTFFSSNILATGHGG